MRVLLIEEDEATRLSVEMMLQYEGFNVHSVDCGEEGIDVAADYEHDCIIVNDMLRDVSGERVVATLRDRAVDTSIIGLLSNVDVEQTVRFLRKGADDCVTKPFHRDELIARIYAVTRRYGGRAVNRILWGPMTLDVESKRVTVNDVHVHLTGKEFALLELLMARLGKTQTKEQVLTALYGGRDEPELKIVDVFICKLRKKLAKCGIQPVETVWGRGYVINPFDQDGDRQVRESGNGIVSAIPAAA